MTDFQLKELHVPDGDPITHVGFSLGDGPDAERSNQWLSGRIQIDGQAMKSVALLRITVLRKAIDLLHAEADRLEAL
ncbi:MAG: hypothetical protein J0H17_20530 [Rhizobiales bacterium]|nr:hypothetical protein [Hyphomicrobiales bacterium]